MNTNSMSYKSKQYIMFAGITTLVFVAVVIAPFIYGLYLTFTSWDGVSRDKPFVGLANYVATFQDSAFWAALGRTFFYSIIAVILVNVVAFILAYLVTRGVKGQNFFRAGFFIPNLIGGIVLGYVWKFVFNRALVAIGESLSVGALSTSWLSTPNGAMACLIIVAVWQYAGYMMLIYVAGFMSVSNDVLEAAKIDGCSRAGIFFRIMLPLIKPAIFSVALIVFINAWNEYIYALTFMTSDEMRTVPVGIAMLPSNYELPWGDIAAASIVVTVPLIILVLIFQKRIIAGLTTGGIKE